MVIGIDASRAAIAQRTGTEAYAYFLLRALLPLAGERGHTIRLYFNQPPDPALFPAFPHVEQRIIPFPRLWTHGRLAWELYRHPPDLFFTPAHVIPFSYRGRSVATVHDLGYHHFPEAHTRWQVAYLRWSTRHNGRSAHTILADSQATKDDLIHFYNTPAANIAVVYPGVDPALQRAHEAEITAVCHKYAITRPYFLYIGTLQPRKNLIRLVEAFAATNLPHQLVLAGKPGWLSQPLLAKISNLQSAISNLHLPGFIPDSDKVALLSGATALLYPSLYEGFGFPLLEAQACETAVLAANTSSLPELAANSALLVDPLNTTAIRDGIIRLAQDERLRQSLVAKGCENVKRFEWGKTAVSVLNLLEKT